MTVRRCLAAQSSHCQECNSPCIVCGTKRWSVNTDCELCLSCEDDKTPYDSPEMRKLREAHIVKEENPAVIILNGE